MQEGKALFIGGFNGVFDFVEGGFEGFKLAPLKLDRC